MPGAGEEIAAEYYVEFITRDDCPLCAKGELVLRSVARRWGLDVRLLNVDEDAALFEEFSERVPVVRSAGGAVITEGRISALRLNAALMKRRMSQLG